MLGIQKYSALQTIIENTGQWVKPKL